MPRPPGADAPYRAAPPARCPRSAPPAARLGVNKIRITGGEPLVRRDIPELCAMLRAVPGVAELCLTTNGICLAQLARPLRKAGVDRLNISLDSLRPERYRAITRVDGLDAVLSGIRAAEDAGFENLKINCVLLGGVNDDKIQDFVRLTLNKPWQVRFMHRGHSGQRSFPGGRSLPGASIPNHP